MHMQVSVFFMDVACIWSPLSHAIVLFMSIVSCCAKYKLQLTYKATYILLFRKIFV